ncbi:polygalacturonase-like [Senna tora]|uniref:Polygalacturonase-like n=1 Tax=Senna tora TaxID=362788 RepID=A0A834SMW1_9FABA|nr:polygalacturonase-like [Senna tora]
MDMNLSIINFTLFLLLASYTNGQQVIFDIRKYGASPNRDITQALKNAWKDACASTRAAKILFPAITYKLAQVDLRGPCKAPIEVQVNGELRAPANPDKLDGNAQWVKFTYINFFTLSGGGIFDGQGPTAWKQNDCGKNKNCKKLSMNFGFGFLNNSIVRDITSKDSKNFHVNVLGCNNMTFVNFKITAPATSLNTDGIHIGRSSDIKVISSSIATGDDCISLGDGSRHINIFNVTCGPGHGISVGSLGKYTNEDPVEGLIVRNCTFKNTDNGVRIKTWPGTPGATTVSDLHYEDITMVNVRNPILIEQDYCPYNQCSRQTPSKVKISKVTFKKIKGTSASPIGVTLVCSSGVPCERTQLSDIDLTFNGAPTTAKCVNVRPIIGCEEEELFGHREDERAEGGDVGLQGLARDGHEVLGEGDADLFCLVLLLEDTAVGPIVRAFMGADGVDELVLGTAAVRGAIGEEDGGTAHAEEAVGDEHGAVVAEVPIESDVLHAYY